MLETLKFKYFSIILFYLNFVCMFLFCFVFISEMNTPREPQMWPKNVTPSDKYMLGNILVVLLLKKFAMISKSFSHFRHMLIRATRVGGLDCSAAHRHQLTQAGQAGRAQPISFQTSAQ
jgi:hypothetical protein